MKQENKSINLNILLGSLFLGYVMIYIDKLSVGISIVSISKDLPMSESTKGLILSAFFLGYALMQVPMSFAINRFGARKVVIGSVLLIGFFDFLFGLSPSVQMLLSVRLLTGMLAHSGYASASSKEVIENFPVEKRTFAKGILISSSGVAGIIGPILLSPIIEIKGWRFAYTLLTLLAITIAIVISFAIPKRKETFKKEADKTISILTVWKNQTIWILFAGAFFINNLLYGLNNWLPTFLTSYRGVSLTQSGMISSAIGAFSLIGAIGGSYLVGRFFQGRDKLVIIITSIIGSLLVFTSYFVHKPFIFIIVLGSSTLFLTLAFVTLMAIPMKLFEGQSFAPSYSTIASGGIIGGAVAQIVIGFLVERSGTFLTAFIYFFILGLLTSLSLVFVKLDSTKKA
ncbi:MFS transporter [Vagococcus carniphilus]|uniref:MFS transporter n=1 Tax=Vagococcus carniphilus TaxID=218144 RepID=A0AAW8U639_9ENTE|nr:MFS transporter [Vagococcus carniphilus]MDT2832027.1 MFS transporter [Vagococcus carniphilus]MDT2834569.1 MFS transporter [Vagococcus carniphilus]MDT2840832.1 MFS transporter [Vagococcus carniphilus]MDT2855496.1 MFS transporter [Vagococcus carniphilus]